jgi:hypothetical protein
MIAYELRLAPELSQHGRAKLYFVEPAVEYDVWDTPDDVEPRHVVTPYILVSVVPNGHPGARSAETLIFGASPEGTMLDGVELPGSVMGRCSHEAALEAAGYTKVWRRVLEKRLVAAPHGEGGPGSDSYMSFKVGE